MKPAHLRRHITTKYTILKDKPVDFFQRKLKGLKRKSTIRNSATAVSKAQEAPYHASLRIAKAGKPHTIGEELCLPLAKELTHINVWRKAAKQLDLVHLSNDTVTHRIIEMADDFRSMLIERIKISRCFSLQLDESTDVADLANLNVYIRYEFEGLFHEDLTAMKKKLQLFVNKIKAGNVSAFPTLKNHLHTYGVALDVAVCDVIVVQLLSLEEQLSEYFPVEATPTWIRNPFTVDVTGIPKDLSSDDTLMSEFKQLSLLNFWLQRQSNYPALSLKSVWFLMPFATTYLYEKGFSALTAIKTNYRNKVNTEPDLRLKLTALVPDIARLSSAKQAHPSH
ncbi:ZBED5 protein, partial [Amia calva]|nr:ZBED5 protein [Amia calva]